MYAHTHTDTQTHTHTHVRTHTQTDTQTHTHTHVRTHTDRHTNTHKHIYTHRRWRSLTLGMASSRSHLDLFFLLLSAGAELQEEGQKYQSVHHHYVMVCLFIVVCIMKPQSGGFGTWGQRKWKCTTYPKLIAVDFTAVKQFTKGKLLWCRQTVTSGFIHYTWTCTYTNVKQ